MSQSLVRIYVHLVWTTYRRQPLLEGERERVIHRSLAAEAGKMGCTVLAIGGVDDHVHMLVQLTAQFDLPRLLHQMKGVSSHLARCLPEGEGFGWQDGYAALSVSLVHVERIRNYVLHQRQHRGDGDIHPAWEADLGPESPGA